MLIFKVRISVFVEAIEARILLLVPQEYCNELNKKNKAKSTTVITCLVLSTFCFFCFFVLRVWDHFSETQLHHTTMHDDRSSIAMITAHIVAMKLI